LRRRLSCSPNSGFRLPRRRRDRSSGVVRRRSLIETPQGFVVVEECRKAAGQNGYRRTLGQQDGWARCGSTTARGDNFLAACGVGGPWYVALDCAAVIAELGLLPADVPGPGHARFAFAELGELYRVLPRVYALAVSLPDAPLQTFLDKTRNLPRTTEAERLVLQRIGQDIFREGLMTYWGGRCPLTGISEPALLRASHIKPWAPCENDSERPDVHNGLLFSALWDAAFDKGLVTFEDDGTPCFASGLSAEARAALLWSAPLRLTAQHRAQLAWHRENALGVAVEASSMPSRGA
jgi:hypothetical protein